VQGGGEWGGDGKKDNERLEERGDPSPEGGFHPDGLPGSDAIEQQKVSPPKKPFYGFREHGKYQSIGGSRGSRTGLFYVVTNGNQMDVPGLLHAYGSISVGEPGNTDTKYLSPGVGVTVEGKTLVYLMTGTEKGKPSTILVCNNDFSDVRAIPPQAVDAVVPPTSPPELSRIVSTVQAYGKLLYEQKKSKSKVKGGDENISEAKEEEDPPSSHGNHSLGIGDDAKDPAFVQAWEPKHAKRVPAPPSSASPKVGKKEQSHGSKKKSSKRKTYKRNLEGTADAEASGRTEKGRKQEPPPSNIICAPGAQQITPSLGPHSIQEMVQVLQQQLGGLHHIGGNIELHFHFDSTKK
jgi:hypothetical protein